MQTTTEATEGHEGTSVGGNGDAALDPRGAVNPAPGYINPALRYMRAKTAMLNAQADMCEAWVEMTRNERMMCTSPVWNQRDGV
jgi:hypothetical protein